jgi:PIN domain nuclease of toxin-antitoxin system
MRLLLDTHAFIWHHEDKPLLSDVVNKALDDPANQIFISTASLWEMTIKTSIGKLILSRHVHEVMTAYVESGAIILPISPDHALATANLPWHHRDPFDRMLIAQALYEGLILVSRDSMFASYELKTLW